MKFEELLDKRKIEKVEKKDFSADFRKSLDFAKKGLEAENYDDAMSVAYNVVDELVNYLDNVRVKRNNFLYRDVENISKEEAAEIIKKAEDFVQEIRTFVHKNRTGVKNG